MQFSQTLSWIYDSKENTVLNCKKKKAKSVRSNSRSFNQEGKKALRTHTIITHVCKGDHITDNTLRRNKKTMREVS